jgi:hypothetical protein
MLNVCYIRSLTSQASILISIRWDNRMDLSFLFIFFEMGSHCVSQFGPNSYSPALAPPGAGTTGVYHHTQLPIIFHFQVVLRNQ